MTNLCGFLVSLIGLGSGALATMVKIPDLKLLAIVLAIGLFFAGVGLIAAGGKKA